jgi:hypothetical protein
MVAAIFGVAWGVVRGVPWLTGKLAARRGRPEAEAVLAPPRSQRWVDEALAVAWFLGLWAPWFAWRWWYYGWPFPNTRDPQDSRAAHPAGRGVLAGARLRAGDHAHPGDARAGRVLHVPCEEVAQLPVPGPRALIAPAAIDSLELKAICASHRGCDARCSSWTSRKLLLRVGAAAGIGACAPPSTRLRSHPVRTRVPPMPWHSARTRGSV